MLKKSLFLIAASLLLSSCSSFFALINVSPSSRLKAVTYSNEAPNALYTFYYPDTTGNDYLRTLRSRYALDSVVQGAVDEKARILRIMDWTSSRWSHNGSNTPSQSDALTILAEAQEGKQFRCVEYGIVATAALNSLGMKARTLGLKTRDVEKVRFGAGHVVSEVYVPALEKWVFIDPQFNLMPTLDGVPLNGVEFQAALYNKDARLVITTNEGNLTREEAASYLNWIGKYLFYYDVLFDQATLESDDFKAINGMTKLTLVPVDRKEPRVFQRRSKIDYSYYTHSLNDFYRKPQ